MFSAPWGRALKVISAVAVVLCVGIGVAGFMGGGGWPSLLFPLLLLLAVPFMVRGYAVEGNALIIRRVGWETRFPLDDLQSAKAILNAMRGALRLCGNCGLFSITGLYCNKALGKFRAFANDMDHTVVLKFPNRTIVVSPDDPNAFTLALKDWVS